MTTDKEALKTVHFSNYADKSSTHRWEIDWFSCNWWMVQLCKIRDKGEIEIIICKSKQLKDDKRARR